MDSAPAVAVAADVVTGIVPPECPDGRELPWVCPPGADRNQVHMVPHNTAHMGLQGMAHMVTELTEIHIVRPLPVMHPVIVARTTGKI